MNRDVIAFIEAFISFFFMTGYELIDFSATEGQAQGLCSAKQMKLVEINDDTERMYLMSMMEEAGTPYWVTTNFYIRDDLAYSKYM